MALFDDALYLERRHWKTGPGFKDFLRTDTSATFLNLAEFAELRTVRYDGEEYVDIPTVFEDLTQAERQKQSFMKMQNSGSDRAQGLYDMTATLYCNVEDIGGTLPERGQRIAINGREGGGGFFRKFYITTSTLEMGMAYLELQEVSE